MLSRRPSCVAIRHVRFEDLGTLRPLLDEAGWNVSYRDAPTADLDNPEVEDADLLIVLGGPIGVYDTPAFPFLGKEIALIERRLKLSRPTLGICLGCQLMAAALGARVYGGPAKEIGWGPITLTKAGRASCLSLLGDNTPVLHWHGDTFDLPDGAVLLAKTSVYENQAFSYGRSALGLQFHIEADVHGLEEWYVGHVMELGAAGIEVPTLRAATKQMAQQLREKAQSFFSEWLKHSIEGVAPAEKGAVGALP